MVSPRLSNLYHSTRSRRLPIGVLLFVVSAACLFSFASRAQTDRCSDSGLRASAGKIGYQWRARSNLCEGLYESNVSAARLHLVSLLRGRLKYDLDKDRYLLIEAPNVSAFSDGPVFVRAVGLPLNLYYRMDAVLTDEGTLRWSVRDVLKPIGLSSRRIGLYGWIADGPDKAFVPLRVTPDLTPSDENHRARIELVVRTSVDVERMEWRFDSSAGWIEAPHRPAFSGQPIRLVIPDGLPERTVVDVRGKRRGREEWVELHGLSLLLVNR